MKVFRIFLLFTLVCSFLSIGSHAQASFLDDTAGISASAQLYMIDLTMAEKAFKTIEVQDSTCIIGTVALDGYDESHDVHVYVTGTGQIVAYYLNDEPVSKIVDWVGYNGGTMTLEGSKLEDAMSKVCRAVDQKLPKVKYFDYRYPAANTIKILSDAQTTVAHKKLKYTAPSADVILNASWSSAVHVAKESVDKDSVFSVDGNEMCRHARPAEGWQIANDCMGTELFAESTAHEMDIDNLDANHNSYAAIVLVCSK